VVEREEHRVDQRRLPSGPLLTALIVIPITQGWSGLRELGSRLIRWRVRWYWYAATLGLPLTVHLAIVGLNVAAGAGVLSLTFTSLTTFLMVFAVRMINPADGPLGEHPGWNGVALPGLQGYGYSPLLATAILAPLVAGWHLPTFFLEEDGLQPSVLVGASPTTAMTHIAIQEMLDGKAVDWMEKVSDEEYHFLAEEQPFEGRRT
jgi:hypothetical protein